MADPADNGQGPKWLGVPDRIWNLLFIAIATAVIGYFSNRTKDAVDTHAAAQVARQEEIKKEVKTQISDVKAAVQKVPEKTAAAVQDQANPEPPGIK